MEIKILFLIVNFLNFLKKKPSKGCLLIEGSSSLHDHFEENDGTLYSEEDVVSAHFDNLHNSERQHVPRHLCFKDDSLTGCIRDPEFHEDSD